MKIPVLVAAAIAVATLPGRARAADDTDYTRTDERTVTTETRDDGNVDTEHHNHKSKDAKGITVGLLGGVEGYTGSLAPRINAGPSYGVNVGLQPTRNVGVELNYLGATNMITDPLASGARVIRNGGAADLKISLSPTRVEPYIFGGVGVSFMNVRENGTQATALGYRDDTVATVPVGAGLNMRVGKFTAGLRGNYTALLNKDFTPPTKGNSLGISNKESGDLWGGTLQLGSTFF